MKTPNIERVARALQTIVASDYAKELELDSAIADLLTDLQHLAVQRGYDFDSLLSVAAHNFQAEQREDSLIPAAHEAETVDGDVDYEYEEVVKEEAREPQQVLSYRDRQSLPLDQQSVHDFDDFFHNCQGWTYLFLAEAGSGSPDRVVAYEPGLPVAIVLAQSALYDSNFMGQFVGSAANDGNLESANILESAIRERIEELNRRHVDYCLLWYTPGDEHVRVDCSGDFQECWDSLGGSDYLAHQLEECLKV